jgi:hypothetical protein
LTTVMNLVVAYRARGSGPRAGLWGNTQIHFQIIYKNSVRTPQETHYVSATKPNRLMLFTETVAVYCENHTEHKYTV